LNGIFCKTIEFLQYFINGRYPGCPDRRPRSDALGCLFPTRSERTMGPQPAPGPPPLRAFACSSSRVSCRASTTAARWREGKGGEGEDRTRRATRGRHEVRAKALRQAAVHRSSVPLQHVQHCKVLNG
jgi:hypothetical protein